MRNDGLSETSLADALEGLSLDLAPLIGEGVDESLTSGHGMTEAGASFCCAPPPNCCNCSCS
ncbi:thiomuracin/GE37468 family thiazolyl RiPP peptide [Kitasatospora sp. NBC_01266]|uniref:thiomuracin/GE37468 family thiazolyl RiPP peptide n=1 Tax=Kitasatospora sp. NBC_01266 TaxID=2903572 RepID=UPI002E331EA9|nr:thiomuracin/GE37468 family thiazolyl RiPP peptide [Kitasatospora sp. NBC_01266]